jgi:hypothetical protein
MKCITMLLVFSSPPFNLTILNLLLSLANESLEVLIVSKRNGMKEIMCLGVWVMYVKLVTYKCNERNLVPSRYIILIFLNFIEIKYKLL